MRALRFMKHSMVDVPGVDVPGVEASLPISAHMAHGSIPFAVRRLSLEEHHRLIESGFFGSEERVELIQGVLHTMSPRGPRHGSCLTRLLHLIFPCVEEKALVRVQDPITISAAESEPEPDLVAAVSQPRAYANRHPEPEEVLFLVEVAESSLDHDREVKGPLYAAAGIADYWVINLVDDVVEVYREPVTLADGTAGYRTVHVFMPGEVVQPLHFADCRLAVSDVIPAGTKS